MPDPDLHIRIAVLERQHQCDAERLDLQAKEYERRLSELNHAHEKANEDKARFLDSGVYYAQRQADTTWRDEANATLAELRGRTSGITSAADNSRWRWGIAIALLLGLASLALQLMQRGPK